MHLDSWCGYKSLAPPSMASYDDCVVEISFLGLLVAGQRGEVALRVAVDVKAPPPC
jgi:hypothetical protein